MISETELDTSIERQKRQALSRMKSELRAEVRDPARAEAALIELYECLGRDPSRLADTDKESPREEAPARRGVPHSFRFPSVDAGLLTGLRLR